MRAPQWHRDRSLPRQCIVPSQHLRMGQDLLLKTALTLELAAKERERIVIQCAVRRRLVWCVRTVVGVDARLNLSDVYACLRDATSIVPSKWLC